MKKTLNILKSIITWIVVIVAVGMMVFTIVSVTTFDRVDRNILGYRAFIVLSDSMSADNIKAGDLILSKEVDPSTLEAGDIISYQSTNEENYGEVVTHKIRTITEDETGLPGFITYGTTTGTDDEGVVNFGQVLGQHSATLHGVGSFFQFLKTVPGYIVCILIPFLILIILQGINSIKLFKKYKKEQMEELNEEKAKIENERLESQKMMEELKELREQLKATKGEKTSEDTDAPSV